MCTDRQHVCTSVMNQNIVCCFCCIVRLFMLSVWYYFAVSITCSGTLKALQMYNHHNHLNKYTTKKNQKTQRFSFLLLLSIPFFFVVVVNLVLINWQNGPQYQRVLTFCAFLTGAILKGLILQNIYLHCLCMFSVNLCQDRFCGF